MLFARRVLLGLSLLFFVPSVFAFQPLRTDAGKKLHWEKKPVYYLNKKGTTSACISDLVSLISNGFNQWASVPNMSLEVEYGGTTKASNFCGMDEQGTGCDSLSLVIFADRDNFPYGALAMTVNTYQVSTGVIIGTDIVFNDGIKWSEDPYACGGESSFSLPAVATHEIGHFYGLDHSFSAYVGAHFSPSIAPTMYPYYFGNEYWQDMVSLEQDDIAGIVWLYHSSSLTDWAKIKGRVSWDNGIGMFGVQVTALRASDKVPMVSTFTINGNYTLFGLPAGDYYVYAHTPYEGGQPYTTMVSDYWRNADQAPYILLYKQVKVKRRKSLGDSGTAFSKPGAKIITVSAGEVRKGINFSYPAP